MSCFRSFSEISGVFQWITWALSEFQRIFGSLTAANGGLRGITKGFIGYLDVPEAFYGCLRKSREVSRGYMKVSVLGDQGHFWGLRSVCRGVLEMIQRIQRGFRG